MDIQKALKNLRTFFKTQKRLPNYQELAHLMGFASKNAAYKLAQKLIDEGYIEKDSTGKLLPKRLFTPLFAAGIVKAGSPTPAHEDFAQFSSFDEYLVTNPDGTYLLNVSGDSMIDAGIHDGDLVVVDRTRTAHDGDIVIANVDGEWTMKYYRKFNDKVELVPANSKYSNIIPKLSLEISGVVVSSVRKYH